MDRRDLSISIISVTLDENDKLRLTAVLNLFLDHEPLESLPEELRAQIVLDPESPTRTCNLPLPARRELAKRIKDEVGKMLGVGEE